MASFEYIMIFISFNLELARIIYSFSSIAFSRCYFHHCIANMSLLFFVFAFFLMFRGTKSDAVVKSFKPFLLFTFAFEQFLRGLSCSLHRATRFRSQGCMHFKLFSH